MTYHTATNIQQLTFGYDEDVTDVSANGLDISICVSQGEPLQFRAPDQSIADLLVAMKLHPITEQEILALDRSALVLAILERLSRGTLVAWQLRENDTCVLSIRSLSPQYNLSSAPPPKGRLYLSRFAYMRRDDGHLVLESSEAAARVIIHAQSTGIGSALCNGLAHDHAMAQFLWRAGFMVSEHEEESDSQSCWPFHDRLFHSNSRGKFAREIIGGDYHFNGKVPSPSALKPAMEGKTIALPAVSSRQTNTDSTLQTIMETRRSIRQPGEQPLTLTQLGNFLHRTSRTIAVRSGEFQDLPQRPYPGGGSIYELEVYIANWRCDGIAQGIFHYKSDRHCLVALPDTQDAAQQILQKSSQAMAGAPQPDVVIIITSRLPRLAWKYSKIAYRVTLINAGVLIQTMYLTATDMKLAGCANGLGDHQAFHDAVDVDSWEETAVAEFALSGTPDQTTTQGQPETASGMGARHDHGN